MEYFGKKSVSSILRTAVLIALIIELVSFAAIIFSIFQSHLWLSKNLPEKMAFYSFLRNGIFWLFAFFITLQLQKLINSSKCFTVFSRENVRRVRIILMILLGYFLADFVLCFFNTLVMSNMRGGHSFGNKILDGFVYFIFAVNFKVIFLAVVTYALSLAFKKGYELEEQTSLTI